MYIYVQSGCDVEMFIRGWKCVPYNERLARQNEKEVWFLFRIRIFVRGWLKSLGEKLES